MPTRNYGLAREKQPWLYGPDSWTDLANRLEYECGVLALLYVELGLLSAEYHANWGV